MKITTIGIGLAAPVDMATAAGLHIEMRVLEIA